MSKKDQEGNKVAKGTGSIKIKKPPAHLHIGKPAPHLFSKATRAYCDWAPKLESVLLANEKNRSHK